MLNELKLYFNITTSQYDSVLTLLITKVTALQQALHFSEELIFPCVVEDFSRYLKSGNTSFKTSQAADISRYSPELYSLIKSTIHVVAY